MEENTIAWAKIATSKFLRKPHNFSLK